MASTVTRTKFRLDTNRNANLFENTETAVGGSATTMMDAFSCVMFNRYSIQIFNGDGSVVGVAKVWASLKDSPGAVGGSDWTQVGDDITIANNTGALKAISTTGLRYIAITMTIASGTPTFPAGDCKVFLQGQV